MDSKAALLPFSSPPPPCSLLSDRPGTGLLGFLVRRGALEREAPHDTGHSASRGGLQGPSRRAPCFPAETFHFVGNEVTHRRTRVTGEKSLVPRRGRASEEVARKKEEQENDPDSLTGQGDQLPP